jgi:YHS domain-containing protein
MFRIIFYLLCTVFLISFVRSVIGVIGKALSALLGPAPKRPSTPAGGNVPLTGELRRDPVCGTYIATSTSLKHAAGSETVYFCSAACRDKFLASAASR